MPDIEEFLRPISDDAPAGEDVRYEVVYDEIRDARESDPDLPQGEWETERRVADFKAVAKMAGEVLRDRSKDLQIAAWLMEAWIDREGFAGLHAGLDLQRELLDRFWDHVYPEIDDGDLEYRAAPLEWIAGYLGPRLREVPLNPAGHGFVAYRAGRALGYEEAVESDPEKRAARQAEIDAGKVSPEAFDAAADRAPKEWYRALVGDIEASLAAIDALEAFTDERFGDVAPSFRPLREDVAEIERVARRIFAEKLEADPDPVEAPPMPTHESSVPGEPQASASGSAAAAPMSAEPTSRDDAGGRIASAARWLRRSDPLDPAPYLMIRGLRWGELRRDRGEVDPRLLAAPPTATRTHLKGLLLDGEWAALLEASEEVMATPFGRGWLDLQRYVFTALDGLGPDYEAVASSLKGALRSLLVDLPELPDLTLMDDTPTANRETRLWLQEEGLAGPLSEAEQARMEPTGAAVAGRDALDRARERVRAGQPQKAIELLMRAADDEGHPRGRALRRMQAARVMVDHGLAQVAMPILRDIMTRIEEHRLEEWEDSETVAVPMALLYRCLEATDGDASEREQLYLRVCRLDPLQAMHFSTGADGASEADDAAEGASDDGVQEA
ncbi:type VI secretion system protein TssA [Gaopeijia maritima]|uniref:type VI secretion system protein TssA n=1 Tax=Gaopeijia maritima TaxID=3119007 RepID=UPI003253BF99